MGRVIENKRGIFFSIDALIALGVIILGTLFIYPLVSTPGQESFVQGDIISVLSTLKVGEINNSYVQSLISQGVLIDLNQSVIEQIGELYVTNKTIAKLMTESIFDGINSSENFGIWFGTELIASSNKTSFSNAKNIRTNRQIVSGIQEGDSITAFSARAYLSKNLQNKYFYFGGYVGEGNITGRIKYSGTIKSAKMELAVSEDFDVYVNGIYQASFSKSPSLFVPSNYTIPIDDFVSGVNYIDIVGGNNLNLGGGFIKVSYEADIEYPDEKRYYFPGIAGVINLYDGFYVPGDVLSVDIFLHLNSSLPIFLNVGDVTVYNSSTVDEENINILDSTLSSILNYNSLSRKSTPVRFGFENASYLGNQTRPADVFSVTDLSGSMVECNGGGWLCCIFSGDNCGSEATCTSCGGTFEDKLTPAKDANKIFIDYMLNGSAGHRVGLVGYDTTANPADFHQLSTDNVSLKAKVDSWTEGGSTCICCGVNSAVSEIVAESSPERFKSIVVMSDGEANVQCAQQGTGNAKQDAINAACDAFNDNDIRVYTVGFGTGVDSATLISMANCGNGSYYSTVDDLLSIYEQIANDLLETIFYEQSLNVTGNFFSKLYPDSYIEFDYNETANPFGLITTTEKKFDNSTRGNFILPLNSQPIESVVISYSGPRWTDNVYINYTNIYNLSSYGDDYLLLGDPYSINVPNSYIQQNNVVDLTTGLSPGNSTEGSSSNKIIYTILQSNVSAYSSLSSASEGCIWTIEFESGSQIVTPVPSNYAGSNICFYTSTGQNISNTNDAMEVAVLNLLELLDYDSDGRLDVEFTSQDLKINPSTITGIPYDWSTEIQVRTWN